MRLRINGANAHRQFADFNFCHDGFLFLLTGRPALRRRLSGHAKRRETAGIGEAKAGEPSARLLSVGDERYRPD